MEIPKKVSPLVVFSAIGFVIALISLLISFVPCIGIFAAIPAAVALIVSIISNYLSRKADKTRSLSFAAVIISMLSLIISIAWGLFIYNSSSNLNRNDTLKNQQDSSFLEKIID